MFLNEEINHQYNNESYNPQLRQRRQPAKLSSVEPSPRKQKHYPLYRVETRCRSYETSDTVATRKRETQLGQKDEVSSVSKKLLRLLGNLSCYMNLLFYAIHLHPQTRGSRVKLD